jgi:hypothetical protein
MNVEEDNIGVGKTGRIRKKNPERGRVLSMGIFGTKLKMGVIWI